MTVADLTKRFAGGDLTSSQHIRDCLAGIDAIDEKLRAWVEVDREGALAAAQEADQARGAGRSGGTLQGLAVGIKDIIDVAGLPTRAGAAPFAHRLPQKDAAVVEALRRAGAIVLGKTATTQFAYIDPAPTRNPWNPEHTPGGSSSGSAAAVAAGMVPLAIGTQTVGSVLRPAAYCGITGFKPGRGRISLAGIHPLASTLDHVGVFGRRVADVGLAFDAVAVSPAGEGPEMVKPSIGLLRGFYGERAGPEVVAHLDAVAAKVVESGGWVEQVPLPFSPEQLLDASNTILRYEAAAYHRPMFAGHADDYAPNLRRLVASGLETPEADYQAALDRRAGFQRALAPLLENFDVLMLPTAPATAPKGLDSTGDPVFCALASMAGVPSISLPSGIGESGLPLAIQLVGREGGEAGLLATARWLEERLAFTAKPRLQ